MHRLYELVLNSDTIFAELMMAVISVVAGIWLTTPAAELRSNHTFVDGHILDAMGMCLLLAGLLKVVGVFRGKLPFRKVSCMLAVVVWVPTAYAIMLGVSPARMASALAVIMAVFNLLVFIRLHLLCAQRLRNGGAC